MRFKAPSNDDLDIEDERYIEDAMEVIERILGGIKFELEKQVSNGIKAIRNPDEQDCKEKYEELQREFRKLRDQFEAFAAKEAGAGVQAPIQNQLNRARLRIQELEANVERLQTEQTNNQAHANQLLQNRRILNTELATLRERSRDLQEDVDDLRLQLETANADATRYRGMIPRENPIPHDDDFWIDRFRRLHNQTMDLVQIHLNLEEPPDERRYEPTARDMALRQIWERGLNLHERGNRVMAAIFEFLNDEILFKPAFGLDNDNDERVAIEAGLVGFERLLQNYPEDGPGHHYIVEWRRLTGNCSDLIMNENGRMWDSLSTKLLALEALLEPIRGNSRGLDYHRSTMLLCLEAFALSLLMRKEPGYELDIEIPDEGSAIPEPRLGVRSLMEVADEERAYPAHLNETIAYTRFGGLVRLDRVAQQRIAVVPASVIMRREEEL